MAVCANCARALRPEWKFCVSCGTPSELASTAGAAALLGMEAPAPTLPVTPPPPAMATPMTSIRTLSRERARRRRVDPLAIAALVLGCLLSPLAALFGHLALARVAATGARGRMPALIAVVLGYSSLALVAGLAIVYLVSRA